MLLATILGLILTPIVAGFIFIIVGIAALSGDNTPKIVPQSVLELELKGAIVERSVDNPFEKYAFPMMYNDRTLGLNTLAAAIKHAKEDDNIEGICLNISNFAASFAVLEELRNCLLDFKASGKFVYAYSEGLSKKAYYLATASDKVFLHPQGMLEFQGLSSEVMFYKGLLDKIDLDVQIIRHGTYKSAVEPFMLDKMSEASKEQVQTYLNSMWDHIVGNISKSRSIDVKKIHTACDSLLLIGDNEYAVKNGFIDSLLYRDQYEAFLCSQMGINQKNAVNRVSLKDYKKTIPSSGYKKDNIAVIYAVGSILDDEGDPRQETIGYSTAEELAKARKDENVKAIVFRINSGGGSALTSETIWREVDLARKEKPVVISMSDYAASGGYYIACAGSYIVAQPTTITGSIGVFSVIPNFEKLLANKLGITIDRVTTNPYADLISVTRKMTAYERNVLQKNVENFYATFIQRVADGRNLSTTFVDSIGQGRVWSGVDALRLNLVDTLGGLDVAVAKAAELANITNYSISEYPVLKEFFQEFVETFLDNSVSSKLQKSNLYQTYTYFNFVETALEIKGVQARIPYKIEIY
jgi:protease-4